MKRHFIEVLVVLILFITSCQPKNEGNAQKGFTYEIQLAEHDFAESIKKGAINNKEFITEFEAFPWSEQVESSNQIQKSSPTISVNNTEDNEIFWISAGGTKDEVEYYMGHVYPKDKTNEDEPRWVVIHEVEDELTIKKCFELFFAGRTADLKDKYSILPKYGEMEEFQR